MIIGWRGYGGKPNDAPEHWVMGEKTKDYFKMININFKTFEDEDEDEDEIKNMLKSEIIHYLDSKETKALIIKKGVII